MGRLEAEEEVKKGKKHKKNNKECVPGAIRRGNFPTLFNLFITRVTRKGTNHGGNNSLARTIPKLVSQPSSEEMLSGVWDKEGRGCRRNSTA